jgi:MoxR-like ATPase
MRPFGASAFSTRNLEIIISVMNSINEADRRILDELETTADRLQRVRESMGRVIYGQDEVISLALTAILGGGHALLVGAPGLAKTKLAINLGRVLGRDEKRVQFTPDLMPADIVGAEVLEESDQGRRHFRFIPGPVFCQLLMADEINRASPRTQSALLQAMQEHHVTVAGVRHDLPSPFHVLATQNPIEQEGTYPLPEAQLDRFLLEIDVPYPDLEAERRMLFATTGNEEPEAPPVFSSAELKRAQRLVRMIPVGESVADAILSLVRSARPGTDASAYINNTVSWGPGPRASQALMLGARARALLDGRLSPSLEDVAALAKPVLRHRMAVTFAARAEGTGLDDVIDRLTGSLG